VPEAPVTKTLPLPFLSPPEYGVLVKPFVYLGLGGPRPDFFTSWAFPVAVSFLYLVVQFWTNAESTVCLTG
jgi:hypothetical protein